MRQATVLVGNDAGAGSACVGEGDLRRVRGEVRPAPAEMAPVTWSEQRDKGSRTDGAVTLSHMARDLKAENRFARSTSVKMYGANAEYYAQNGLEPPSNLASVETQTVNAGTGVATFAALTSGRVYWAHVASGAWVQVVGR